VAPSGTLIGANFPISIADGAKNRCDLAYGAAGNDYLVVWGDTRSGGNDIYGQRLDATGAVTGDPFPIADSELTEILPAVAYDAGTRGFLVVWSVLNESTDYDIVARRVPGSGVPSLASFTVSDAVDVQTSADLAQNTNTSEVMILWQDFRATSYDIFGQRWIGLPHTRLHRHL
jgi:hypothetical protein